MKGGSAEVDSAVNTFKFNTGFNLFTIGSNWRTGKRLANTCRLGIRPMGGVISAFGAFKYELKDGLACNLKNTVTYEAGTHLHVSGGIDISYSHGTGVVKLVDTMPQKYSKTFEVFTGGPFLGLEWKATDRLTVSPGMRCDLHHPLDFPGTVVPEFRDYSFDNETRYKAAPSLRISTAYEISPRHSIRFLTGSYTALPHMVDYSLAGSLFGDYAAVFEIVEETRIRPAGTVISPFPEGAPGDTLRSRAYFATRTHTGKRLAVE